MSFARTLATLAIGFAAAKGASKVKDMGGMDALREKMRDAGKEGGMADQMGQMAEKFGMPGGADAVKNLMGKLGGGAADASQTAEAGLGSLFSAMSGAAAAGASSMTEMFSAVTQGTPLGDAAEENAKLMIRAMIMSAKADGEIDADERTQILDALGDASDEEMAFVEAALDAPVDAAALAADAGASASAQVYSGALMAISVDTDAERAFLSNLAQALQLDAEKRAEIHASMGKPLV